MDTVVFVDSTVINYFATDMVLAKINAEIDTATAEAYHISGYPTLVLTDKNGDEIDRIIGYLPPAEFMATVRDYRNGVGTLADLLRQAEENSSRELYFRIADKYKYRGGSGDAETWFTKVISSGQPTDSLTGEARMAIADMYRRGREYDRAITAYTSVQSDFKDTPFAENAAIMTAVSTRQKGDTLGAIALFEQFVKAYPESEDAEYATGQITKLKTALQPDSTKK